MMQFQADCLFYEQTERLVTNRSTKLSETPLIKP